MDWFNSDDLRDPSINNDFSILQLTALRLLT